MAESKVKEPTWECTRHQWNYKYHQRISRYIKYLQVQNSFAPLSSWKAPQVASDSPAPAHSHLNEGHAWSDGKESCLSNMIQPRSEAPENHEPGKNRELATRFLVHVSQRFIKLQCATVLYSPYSCKILARMRTNDLKRQHRWYRSSTYSTTKYYSDSRIWYEWYLVMMIFIVTHHPYVIHQYPQGIRKNP